MNTLDAIKTKRAVRKFKEEAIPEEIIKQILLAGKRAQSSKNTQPWTFIVVQDKAMLKNLSECGQWAGHLAGAAFAVVMACNNEWDFDLGQAAAYMQLAAWDAGVGSCLAHIYDQAKARSLLGIPEEKFCDIAISFGIPLHPPREELKPEGRRPLEDVIRWEKW